MAEPTAPPTTPPDYFDDDPWCDTCQGTGWTDCRCGGDMCVCENRGEQPCPACEGGLW